MKLSIGIRTVLLIAFILAADQILKILVKTNMTIGESITVFNNWFYIRFIENPGMAFGIDIPGKYGKPLLTVFRIIAVSAIGWYMNHMIVKKAKPGLIFFMALIFAGAMGNIIDCTFYGLIFNESTYFDVAVMFPEGGGYAPLLQGKVVDMFYFPVISGAYPAWFPWLGGQEFVFFRPIFNIADSSITIGIFAILIFQKRYFTEHAPVITEETDRQDLQAEPSQPAETDATE
ncbi:MAG: lipoprotein signal peptidase [Bacteroidales bacterium]|nr:lipoprotein signal peptidase [Bacteroidales bacterium]